MPKRRYKKELTKKKFFHSKIVLLTGLIILVLISLAVGKEFWRSYQINQEVRALQTEVARLEAGNEDLKKMTEYLGTDFFVEKEARLRLGLRKPGEQVVVIPDEFDQLVKTSEKEYDNMDLINPQKWWQYFFGLHINI